MMRALLSFRKFCRIRSYSDLRSLPRTLVCHGHSGQELLRGIRHVIKVLALNLARMSLDPGTVVAKIRSRDLKPMDFYIAAWLEAEALRPEGNCFVRHPGIFPLRRCLIAVVLAVSFAACSEPIRHNDELAQKRALEFAEIALISRDFDKGYALLSSGAKSHVPLEKFRETLSRLHPDGYPTRITATGHKPMFNEKAIYVYLSGEASGKHFQYTITMEGTAASDYSVSIINRTL